MLSMKRKTIKKLQNVKLSRSDKDWEKIVTEAKRKELNWKFLREEGMDEFSEREQAS